MRLQTERLTLREFADGDAEVLGQMNTEPEVMRYIGNGLPRDPEQAFELVEKFKAAWAERGYGTFAVEIRESGEFAGFAAMAPPTFLPEIMPVIEVGWRLRRDLWGKGYATEAAREVIRFAFEEVGLDRVVSCIHSENAASIRVAEKLGMALERETVVPGYEVPCNVYELKA
ncbi:MAG TPA: GNAT family N-acetyltransferase [Glycomyces sp.]|nr:GNAT family N-acetyltransferase [Glycomyces sp.]